MLFIFFIFYVGALDSLKYLAFPTVHLMDKAFRMNFSMLGARRLEEFSEIIFIS